MNYPHPGQVTTSNRKVCKCDIGQCCAPSGYKQPHSSWGQHGVKQQLPKQQEANIRTRLPYDANWGRSMFHLTRVHEHKELTLKNFESPFLLAFPEHDHVHPSGHGNHGAAAMPSKETKQRSRTL